MSNEKEIRHYKVAFLLLWEPSRSMFGAYCFSSSVHGSVASLQLHFGFLFVIAWQCFSSIGFRSFASLSIHFDLLFAWNVCMFYHVFLFLYLFLFFSVSPSCRFLCNCCCCCRCCFFLSSSSLVLLCVFFPCQRPFLFNNSRNAALSCFGER